MESRDPPLRSLYGEVNHTGLDRASQAVIEAKAARAWRTSNSQSEPSGQPFTSELMSP